MLLCVTVFSVTGAVNIEKDNNLSLIPKPASTGIFWEDNFDNYTLGPLHGQGGWESWDNDPATTAYVTDNQSRSPSNSVEIAWFSGVYADIVHQFSGVDSGKWNFTSWQYIPSDMEGLSYYLLLNKYEHGGPHVLQDFSLQLEISATTGRILDYDNPDDWLPLITDDWVEIRVEIDFGADIQTVYYGGVELLEKGWTDGVAPGGQQNLGCVDLFADYAYSSSVYYDDFVLEGELGAVLFCEGDLHFGNVSAGATLTDSFTVENIGGPDSLLDWEIVTQPSWGEWTFDPEQGDDLPPGPPVTVQVTVVAPKQKDFYAGIIKIVNKENPGNTCTIAVSMTTPRNRAFNMDLLFLRFLEQHPYMFPIIRHMLGL